jgi:hypothetical protein
MIKEKKEVRTKKINGISEKDVIEEKVQEEVRTEPVVKSEKVPCLRCKRDTEGIVFCGECGLKRNIKE